MAQPKETKPCVPIQSFKSGSNLGTLCLEKNMQKILRKLALTSAISFMCFLLPMSTAAANESPQKLIPFINPSLYQMHTDTKLNTVDFTCPDLPDMDLYDLKLNSVYDQNDPSRSKINPYAYHRYHTLRRPISQFEEKLIRMANQYMLSGSRPADKPIAGCILSWLEKLADEEALLGRRINKTGRVMRHWVLASISSAYAQISMMDAPTAQEQAQMDKIDWWLEKLAFAVINDYPTKSPDASNHSNLSYWAAYAVANTALALKHQDMFDWAMMRTRKAIADIQPDGTLEKELIRNSKALQYHTYALSPLTMLIEIAHLNGHDMASLNDDAYHKLVRMVLTNLQDPSFLEELTGHSQFMDKVTSFGNMAWVELYSLRHYSPQTHQYLMLSRPFYNRRLGGDITKIMAPRHRQKATKDKKMER